MGNIIKERQLESRVLYLRTNYLAHELEGEKRKWKSSVLKGKELTSTDERKSNKCNKQDSVNLD